MLSDRENVALAHNRSDDEASDEEENNNDIKRVAEQEGAPVKVVTAGLDLVLNRIQDRGFARAEIIHLVVTSEISAVDHFLALLFDGVEGIVLIVDRRTISDAKGLNLRRIVFL
jgi:hypothetical protein